MKTLNLKKSRIIGLIFVILIFAVGSLTHVLMMVKREKNPMDISKLIPEFSTGIIQSGSMSPVLEKGDLVYIKKEQSYETGDIVLVIDEKGRQVMHRLVIYNTFANIILTKGDANDSFDKPLSCDAIKGKLFFSIPKVGKVLSIFKLEHIKGLFSGYESIGACYRSAVSGNFSMEVSPSEEKESHFSIDEIDVWLME